MATDATRWWVFLCAVAALNIAAWALTAWCLPRRAVRVQLALSAVYVLGCAWRSVFPVFDVPRLAMIDSWASTIVLGRTVATVAELCFAAQWAHALRTLGSGDAFCARVAAALVPTIALAEVFSWHAVLTTSNWGHAVEESLWAAAVTAMLAALLRLWPALAPRVQRWVALAAVAGVGYVLYMVLVDVPMYWQRWLADEASGRRYLSLADGLVDAATRRVVSTRWDDWRTEVIWMTLYFSAAVWLSIAIVHASARAAIARR